MRPSLLDPLFAPVTTLDGVGPKVAALLKTLLAGNSTLDPVRVRDLLFHLPNSLVDRRQRSEIATASHGSISTLTLTVDRHQAPDRGSSTPYKVFCFDETGEIALTYFRGQAKWLEPQFPVGEVLVVSGQVEWFNGRPSMVHPDFVVPITQAEGMSLLEPIYPMTAGLSAKLLRRAIDQARDRLPSLPEWIDQSVVNARSFPAFEKSLDALHRPTGDTESAPGSPARSRLAYDEFLANQLALALSRERLRRIKGRKLLGTNNRSNAIRQALPFQLTDAQEEAIREIQLDMAREDRMLRLLQGDVGAGKTVVALMAMATAAEAGAQSVLLAPTEILARQHFDGLSRLAVCAGLQVELLTGRDSGKAREKKLQRIETGESQIVVGTHALFQDDVTYDSLGLVIIDEQHRFGVHQRLALTSKGKAADLLVMTATPIPRTLVLAAFGDMDVSRLAGKPAGRKPITTVALPVERLEDIIGRADKALDAGEQIYWVCPLVEESEKSDLMAAEERFRQLQDRFGDRVGLVHGRMKGEEKDVAMGAFKAGRTQLLVATTVIEVGVDVPDASIIIIEHAERFGLSQLHQLRGRVGRGAKASSCVLLYRGPLGETAAARLNVMRETEDGFRIAEEDLKLRGEGDLLGTQQSGMPFFRLAMMEHHAHLMEVARDDARLILNRDPELSTPRGQALRMLLYLFGKDEAVRLIRAG